MATYLLVHGAWFGGWCWKRVSPYLRAAGHEVFAPTLTGLGERAHLLGPDIGLDTHVQDILNVIEYEDLSDVILVAHSYGAMVISGVAEKVPDKLEHLVYVDAFIPFDGQAMIDFFAPGMVAQFKARAQAEGKGFGVPSLSAEVFGITDPADLEWTQTRLRMQPLKSFLDPIRLENPHVGDIPHTYIYCLHPRSMVEEVANRIRQDKHWRFMEMSSGHAAMIVEPARLAELLLQLAVGYSI